MATPLISLEDVKLQLLGAGGPVKILRGIDLAINPGETVGVVGPSGSGKTSMLMVMAGLEPPTGGRLTCVGQDLGAMDEDARARFRLDHVGIVFQGFHLVPTMSALENVAIPLELLDRDDVFARAEAALCAVGLGDRLDHYPAQLSGGEQQRVALARSFVTEPEILLADEPTGSLDQATGNKVLDLMFELKDRANSTLVMVTHSNELAGRCGRLVRLVDGRIAGEGAAELLDA